MEVNNYTRLIRGSYDVGIFGKKNCGKTLLMSWLLYLHWKYNNALVFTNYWVNFPHIRVNNAEDFNKMYEYPVKRRKVFGGDDFEFWFHSRDFAKKLNRGLLEIMLNWGKISCSLIYTTKRQNQDIEIREGTCEYYFPELEVKYTSNNEVLNDFMKDYMDFLQLHVIRINSDLEFMPDLLIDDLVNIGKLYSTTEKVDKID